MALGDYVSRKIGGVPAWAWGLAIAAGIVGFAYWQRMRSNEGPTVAPESMPYADGGVPADAGDIQGVPTVTPGGRSIPLETNPAWVRYVTDALVASGEDPVQVGNALSKALNGLVLTQREKALWNIAVTRYGSPPEEYPPIQVEPVPTTTPTQPTPQPPPGLWVTVGPVPKGKNGTSYVLNAVMRGVGYAGTGHLAQRNRVWYHPNNKALVAKYGGNWTKLQTGDRIFLPVVA